MNEYPIITTWPKFDSAPEIILPFIFDLRIDQIEVILGNVASEFPDPDNNEAWEDFNIANWIQPYLEKIGLPSDPSQHEQPYQAAMTFPFSLVSYDIDDQHETELNRTLFVLWEYRLRQLSEQFYSRHQLEDIRCISLALTHYLGSDNRVTRQEQAQRVNSWSLWLKHSHGCYCLKSGKLVKPELTTLREHEYKTWSNK